MSNNDRLGSDPLSFIKDTTEKSDENNSEKQENQDKQKPGPIDASNEKAIEETVEAVNLNIYIKQLNSNTVSMTLDGELSIYNAIDLKNAIFKNFKKNHALELDLSNIAKIDTAGYQLMLAVKKEADKSKKVVIMNNPSVEVGEIFDLYGESLL